MLRRRSLLLIGVAALGLGARAALAAPSGAGGTSPARPNAPASSDWSIAGTLQAMTAQTWDVQGFAIHVNSATQITGGTPTLGSSVAVQGMVLPDGTWLATAIQVGASATPTVTSTATATALPTLVLSATPTRLDVDDNRDPEASPPPRPTEARTQGARDSAAKSKRKHDQAGAKHISDLDGGRPDQSDDGHGLAVGRVH